MSILFTLTYNYCRAKELDPDSDAGEGPEFYALWAGSVIGPFVHILALVHVLLWGLPSSVVGSIVSALNNVFNCQRVQLHR